MSPNYILYKLKSVIQKPVLLEYFLCLSFLSPYVVAENVNVNRY